MKYIDPDLLRKKISDMRVDIAPTKEELEGNSALKIYWNAVDVTLHAIETAILTSTVEVKG